MESQIQPDLEDLYSIGELSRRTGLPVKTLRFYADEGLLPPAHVADSRYRYFNAESLTRLHLIRTLREADFSLPAIREVLEHHGDFQAQVQLQLQMVEAQMQALVRQQAVLQAASRQQTTVQEFATLMQHARLSLLEREALLARHFQPTFNGTMDAGWWPEFWATAGATLPEDPTVTQLSAWLELSQLVQDPVFQQAIRAQIEPFWQEGTDPQTVREQTFQMGLFFDQAVDAAIQGVRPESLEGQALIERFSRPCAAALNQSYTPDFLVWWRHHLQSTAHPEVARYWELVALMQGDPPPQIQAGLDWLLAGLEVAIKNPDPSGDPGDKG